MYKIIKVENRFGNPAVAITTLFIAAFLLLLAVVVLAFVIGALKHLASPSTTRFARKPTGGTNGTRPVTVVYLYRQIYTTTKISATFMTRRSVEKTAPQWKAIIRTSDIVQAPITKTRTKKHMAKDIVDIMAIGRRWSRIKRTLNSP